MTKNISDIDLKELIEAETGKTFNKDNKMCCPFHSEKSPSFSVKFDANKGKEVFKCFGCGVYGDNLDFIMKYKNISYKEARQYLGLEIDKSNIEKITDKIENYANWIIKHSNNNSDIKFNKVLGVFNFTDEFNNYLYSKVKFQVIKDNKVDKEIRYFHLEDEKVKAGRSAQNTFMEEVPYNYYRLVKAINEGREVIICEGEKDVETLKHIGFVAASYKNVKNEKYFEIFRDAIVCIIPDNDDAGEKYLKTLKDKIMPIAKSFKIITLPGIKNIPKGDITDWIEQGHSKEEFKKVKKNSLDLNNKNELQQDKLGIYKIENKENESIKHYITNYNIISAKCIDFIDENVNGIELILLSQKGEKIIRRGKVIVFDDVRGFKAFLNSLDLTFKGNLSDLTRLKEWVSKYFIHDKIVFYGGIRFENEGLVTDKGLITKAGVNENIICNDNIKNNFAAAETINTKELKQLLKNLLNVQPGKYLYSMLGTTIHGMMNKFAQEKGIQNTIMLIVGESGTGKSTIMKNIITPILGYGKNYSYKSITSTSKFALLKSLSVTNYPVLGEEFKPSHMSKYKVNEFINLIRDLWENNSAEKGNKDQTVNKYKLTAPFIFDGEENFPGSDKAAIERTMIIYLAKNERPKGSEQNIKWIKENQNIMLKLGRSILNYILEMNETKYLAIRKMHEDLASGKLEDRVESLYVNACTGMYVFNEVCANIIGSTYKGIDYSESILECVREENTEEEGASKSITVDMLIRFNDIVADYDEEDVNYTDTEIYRCLRKEIDYTYIETKKMCELLNKHNKDYGLNEIVLNYMDFNKQCRKNGLAYKSKEGGKTFSINGNKIKFIKFNNTELIKIGCDALVNKIELAFTNEVYTQQEIFAVK